MAVQIYKAFSFNKVKNNEFVASFTMVDDKKLEANFVLNNPQCIEKFKSSKVTLDGREFCPLWLVNTEDSFELPMSRTYLRFKIQDIKTVSKEMAKLVREKLLELGVVEKV